MKYIALLAVVLVGCSSPGNPYPTQQLLIDKQVSAMSRQEVINGIGECESNGMRAVMLYSKRKINGYTTDVVVDVTCAPKFKI